MVQAQPEPAAPEYTEEVAGVFSMQLYDPRDCRDLYEYAKAADGWRAAPVYDEGGPNASATMPVYRSARALAFDATTAPGRDFDARMNRLVKPLINRLWRSDLRTHNATQLVRYAPGDHYVAHVDTIPGADYRYFTVLCYLNDDFEGGHTTFPALRHSFAPRAGRALLFPAAYLHRAEPVVAGEKYVVVTWLCGPPPVRWF